jgi:hypothetical protein
MPGAAQIGSCEAIGQKGKVVELKWEANRSWFERKPIWKETNFKGNQFGRKPVWKSYSTWKAKEIQIGCQGMLEVLELEANEVLELEADEDKLEAIQES